jgi:CDP-diacylglycerol---serine O-phosphatidyltransferase
MMPDPHRETTRRPRTELPLVQLIPNMLTVAALCAGLTAIRFATTAQFGLAAALIVLAAVLDGLDGRVARLLKSESEIGAELDSFADFVSFGVAPGFVMYLWALHDMPHAGWIVALVYIVCCLLRLARFNIISRAAEPADAGYFRGVPSPAGALLAMMPLFFAFMQPQPHELPAPLVAVWILFVGWLMIGKFPTPSFKRATIYTDHVHYLVVGFVAMAAALVTYPWVTLFVLDLAYGLMLLFTWRQRRMVSKHDD